MNDKPLATIYLHGDLKEKFGERYEFYISSLREGLYALKSQLQGFLPALEQCSSYVFLVRMGGELEQISESMLEFEWGSNEYHVVPVTGGSDFGLSALVTAGVMSATTAATVSTVVSVVMITATLASLAMAFIGTATPPRMDKKGDSKSENYTFSGIVNTTEETVPIPVIYGRGIVGGAVIGVRTTSY